ncbi:MAG: hypothetical protein COA57_03010 [Flavobacteriales bacterium]|nr:MAG: hypothetical protein COA57_03010 [Flavobacteriales bacterium]
MKKQFLKLNFLFLIIVILINFQVKAQECGVIYVTPGGALSGIAGTRANPAQISYGLTMLNSVNRRLWLSVGTYSLSNTFIIPDSVIIEGGFNSGTWEKSNTGTTLFVRDTLNYDVANKALIGFIATGISDFRLQDITLIIDDAPANQVSVYGIYLDTCSNYNITRCKVITGNGSDGISGTSGASGVSGSIGQSGLPGNGSESVQPGGAGGVGSNSGVNDGGAGQQSGKHSGSTNPGPGQSGLPSGCGGSGGATGSGPQCSAGCFFGSPSCGSVTPGQNGQAGQNGTDGTPGAVGSGGSIVGGYYIPGSAGGIGANGNDGCGGGGGGGGGGRQKNGSDDVGGSGGGGGGGGSGGTGGIGGTGGGSSFAVFLNNNGSGGVIEDCDLLPGAAGFGGVGGTSGAGGTGNAGGAGGAAGPCSNSYGGNGGQGGNGGNGGQGGSGADGINVALAENGSGIPVTNLGITNIPGGPPDITVDNRGCLNSVVTFSSSVNSNWDFGTNASPQTALGPGPHEVIYSSMGRKTIVFDGDTFTDFVEIFQNGPTIPSITLNGGSVSVGCYASFTTSISGSNYEWVFGNGAIPDTIAGATLQTVDSVNFLSAGTYMVEVFVTTACCGVVKDTLSLVVGTSSLNVTLTASSDSICQGNSITFTASGSYISYDFYWNNSLVQSSAGNTYSTTSLLPGDSVMVLAYDSPCFTNPSAIIYPTVTPIPSVSLASSDADNIICEGVSVTFTASPSGYDIYDFYDGTTLLQSSSSSTYTTTGLMPGNSITVVAIQNNCSSLASNAIVTTVNLLPILTLSTSVTVICDGDNVVITASPSGLSNYEFFVNAGSVQSGALQTYTTSSLINGDVITAVGISTAGCTGNLSAAITFTVNPIPSVTLTTSNDTICLGDNITLTAAPTGYDNYQFFSGASSLDSSSSNTFSTVNLSTGTHSITVVATDLGCLSPASNTETVTVLSGPTVGLSSSDADNEICNGDAVTFSATPTLYQTYEFFINGTSVQSSSSANFTTSALADGDTITVKAADFGCPGPASNVIIFIVNAIPSATLSANNDTICDGDAVTYTTAPAGLDQYDFYLNGTLVQTGIGNTYTSVNATSLDSISVIVIQNNCASVFSNSVTITVNPIPSVSLSVDIIEICEGETVTFNASPSGYDQYEFFVNGPSLQVGADSIYSTNSLGVGNNSIIAIVTDLNCSSPQSNTINVQVNALPAAAITGNDKVCIGESTILTASGGTSYVWNTGDTTTSITESPSVTTNYGVTVTDGNGCVDSTSIEVFVIQIIGANAGQDFYICNGIGVEMNATGGVSYQWTPAAGLDDPNIANPIANPLDTITYTVVVTDGNGCVDTAYITVTPSSVSADAGQDVEINYGAETQLAVLGGTTWNWLPETGLSCMDCQNPIASPLEPITYVATVTNDAGCTASDNVTVTVNISNEIFVPMAFSPNGDGQNEVLYVRGNTIKELYFVVYDRWGKKVFESADKNFGWDGRINGADAESGVYVYLVNAVIVNGNEVTAKGDVSLVR